MIQKQVVASELMLVIIQRRPMCFTLGCQASRAVRIVVLVKLKLAHALGDLVFELLLLTLAIRHWERCLSVRDAVIEPLAEHALVLLLDVNGWQRCLRHQSLKLSRAEGVRLAIVLLRLALVVLALQRTIAPLCLRCCMLLSVPHSIDDESWLLAGHPQGELRVVHC